LSKTDSSIGFIENWAPCGTGARRPRRDRRRPAAAARSRSAAGPRSRPPRRGSRSCDDPSRPRATSTIWRAVNPRVDRAQGLALGEALVERGRAPLLGSGISLASRSPTRSRARARGRVTRRLARAILPKVTICATDRGVLVDHVAQHALAPAHREVDVDIRMTRARVEEARNMSRRRAVRRR